MQLRVKASNIQGNNASVIAVSAAVYKFLNNHACLSMHSDCMGDIHAVHVCNNVCLVWLTIILVEFSLSLQNCSCCILVNGYCSYKAYNKKNSVLCVCE